MQMEAYLLAGLIDPARSRCGGNALFARNKYESLRLRIDQSALNNINFKDTYPLLRIE